MCARAKRGDGMQRVPVVRRGDDNDVRFFARRGEQFAEVFETLGAVARNGFEVRRGLRQLPLIRVAQGDKAALAALQGDAGDVAPPPAAAKQCDTELAAPEASAVTAISGVAENVVLAVAAAPAAIVAERCKKSLRETVIGSSCMFCGRVPQVT
jgi:hypothetical protein